jgi:hypothetical protein
MAYNMFRIAAILQGIAKRVEAGTASSAQAVASGAGAADGRTGLDLRRAGLIAFQRSIHGLRLLRQDQGPAGARAKFMDDHVYPNEKTYKQQLQANTEAGKRWTPLPVIEELKRKARAAGCGTCSCRSTPPRPPATRAPA